MRCPRCSGAEDRVIDSRTSEDGAAIRRRRECLACGRRFTTYERLEEVPFVVVKRSGQREPFERAKIIAGMKAAAKNRPLPLSALEQIAVEIEEGLRLVGPEVGSQQVGLAVLEALRGRDQMCIRDSECFGRFPRPPRGQVPGPRCPSRDDRHR